MDIYDGFTFFNEIELLELRLETLNDIVDYFIIVEADMTFTGKDREYVLYEDHPVFEKYKNKIRYIRTSLPYKNNPDMQANKEAWHNEIFQRNQITQGLFDFKDEDYVIISDLDEIPNPEVVLKGINNKKWDKFCIVQYFSYYYVNCVVGRWSGPQVCNKKVFTTPQEVRQRRKKIKNRLRGGWHYSYCGGVDRIKEKIDSFSEMYVNKPEFTNDEHLLNCLEKGKDLFNRKNKYRYEFIKLEDIKHPELIEWVKKYPHMYKEI